MGIRTVHTKVSISADIIEILTEISKAYASDPLTPMREPNISGALEKGARLYIGEVKRQRPEFGALIEAIEHRYTAERAAEAEESARRNVLKFRPAGKRGRPRKRVAQEVTTT